MDTHIPWTLVIGQPFAPERSTWPADRFEYRYFGGNHLLQLCIASPSPREVAFFESGDVRIGLYIERGVLFFIFRIEAVMDWSDQAISIHLVSEKDRDIPDLAPGMRAGLNMVLVDADTGLVSAMRFVTYSPHFSQVFYRELRRQAATPFDAGEHRKAVVQVYRKYPKSSALARAALLMERPGLQHPR